MFDRYKHHYWVFLPSIFDRVLSPYIVEEQLVIDRISTQKLGRGFTACNALKRHLLLGAMLT